jgi:hypothetical protein
MLFPFAWADRGPADPERGAIDLNLTAFDAHITRSWAMFPAFFRHSV